MTASLDDEIVELRRANAELRQRLDEALAREAATAEVLQVINSSPGDLTPVFEAMLEKVTRLCEASFGLMNAYDGERFRAGAAHRVPAALLEWSARNPLLQFGPGTGPAQIVGGENLIHTVDLTATEAYQRGDPMRRALVDLGGARSHLIAALRKDDALLGTIAVYRQEVRPFSDKQIALLQNFAAQAVIAMENARLLTEARERTKDLQQSLEYQTATSDVLKVISRSTSDVQPVLDTLVETAARLCRSDSAAIAIREGEVYRYVSNTHSGAADPEYFAAMRQRTIVPGRDSVAGLVALEGRVVHIADIRAIPDYAFPEGGELRQRTDEVADLNRGLEARVAEQVEELGRVGRLKRFLAPQLAEMIVSQGDEKILESHRREIVVVFCDLRGYTAFTETAEPEEALKFLREYHGALGPLVSQFEGTLDQFSGDGIMVFFNDPVPCPDPAERAVRMAVAMREEAGKLIAAWRRHGCELGFGAGIAQGYATLGQIGFSDRSGYTAIGTVCNLAARLCAEAKDGQILVSSHIAEAVEAAATLEDLGNLELKGLRRPVAAFNVVQGNSAPDARPNLTVVARGPGG